MRHDWTADSLAWEAERDERREQVARVEALAKWLERWPSGPSFAVVAREIRAALAGPAPVEQQVQS